jgi:hypothetical protein
LAAAPPPGADAPHDHEAAAADRPTIGRSAEMHAAGLQAIVEEKLSGVGSAEGEALAEVTERNRTRLTTLTLKEAARAYTPDWELDPEAFVQTLREAATITDAQAGMIETLLELSERGLTPADKVVRFFSSDKGLDHTEALSIVLEHPDIQPNQARVLRSIIRNERDAAGILDTKAFRAVLETRDIPDHIAEQLVHICQDEHGQTDTFMTLLAAVSQRET